MRVFLCEKPSQGKDIAKHVGANQRGNGFLSGPGVVVTWCIGHLLEQAKPEFYNPELRSWSLALLPVLPSTWSMDVKPSTKDQCAVVLAQLRKATEVVIATDADREGEVIAREMLDRVAYRGTIRRLWLGALDDASVRKALATLRPNEKTLPMYASGLGRSRADWLTGMNMTMAMTSAFGEGGRGGVFHCGRVQTPVLGLIVRRERAITTFKPKTHYQLAAAFEVRGTVLPMDWVMPADRLDKDGHCPDKGYVDAVAQKVLRKLGRVSQVSTTPERELAPLPYCLGSLQRDASAKFGLKAQVVLNACQALYEKHKATTYPRTDCEYLPQSMFPEVPTVLQSLGKADAGLARLVQAADVAKPGRAFNDKKITAHHAIIPTMNPAVSMREMGSVERLVYDMVRRRYLAQFLGDFLFNKTVIDVACEGERFTKTGRTPTSMGWKRAYDGMEQPASKAKNIPGKTGAAAVESEPLLMLPAAQSGDQAINRKAETVKTATTPPKRYTEGTLLAAMESIDKEIDDPRLKKVMLTKEKAGIGTDATRASTIEGLFKREYIANEKKFILPTPRGHRLIETIEGIAPELADPVLTALWEDRLMQIEAGAVTLAQFEAELGAWLKALMGKIRVQASARIARSVPPVQNAHPASASFPGNPGTLPTQPSAAAGPVHPCPNCQKPLRQRTGATGAFWGCTGYPECRCTLPDDGGKPGQRQEAGRLAPGSNAPGNRPAPSRPSIAAASAVAAATTPRMASGHAAAKPCGICGKPMVLRNGARGPFYGCTGFPACRSTAPSEAPEAIKA